MHATEDYILNACQAVIDGSQAADIPGNTMVETSALEELDRVLKLAQRSNKLARDRKYLAKLAYETQDACNPRPVSLLLHNALISAGASGGNPSMASDPIARVALNTLLNILGPYFSHPAYDKDTMLYHRDSDALVEMIKENECSTK